jgi:hypothetical protein
MPAYSFGNRWMGIASLTEPPVPPPLHRLALSQHEAMLHRSDSHLIILPGGERVPRGATRTALSRMGRRYAMAQQWSKSDVCYELGKILQNQDPPERDWPRWLLRRVLTAADHGTSKQAAYTTTTLATSRTRPLPYLPTLFGEVPLSSALLTSLDEFGWQPGNGRYRLDWLAAASIHTSYLYESRPLSDELTPALLGMLAAVGTSWTGLALLDLQIAADPSAGVGEQSSKFSRIRTALPAAIAELLDTSTGGLYGKGEQPPASKSREAVALQICGLLVLLGDFTALGRIVARAYITIRDSGLDTHDWRTDLEQVLPPGTATWEDHVEGPDHDAIFTAVVTDARGVIGRGRADSKTEAKRLAARDYLIRHRPETLAERTPSIQVRQPRTLRAVDANHRHAVASLRRAFALPAEAEPWITQAMLHSSFAYENQRDVTDAGQRDNRILAHHGASVMEALRVAELTRAVIARNLAPTPEQARLGTATDASLLPVFDALDMAPALLRGAGESQSNLDNAKPDAVQAMHAVAWRFLGCQLLDTCPAVTSSWIEESDTSLDAYSQLEQLIKILDVSLNFTHTVDGPEHRSAYRTTITLTRGKATSSLTGPPTSGKTPSKTACAAEVLKRVQGVSDAQSVAKAVQDPLARFLLEGMLRSSAASTPRDVERVANLRLLGLEHLLAGDSTRFRAWADIAQNAAGPVDAECAKALRLLYTRALASARAGEHRALRSRARHTAREAAMATTSGGPAWQSDAWNQLSACQYVLEALTSPGSQTLNEVIAGWGASMTGATAAAGRAAASRAAAALANREIAMIRAVGNAVATTYGEEKGDATVDFEEQPGGSVLTLRLEGVALGEAQQDLLGLAVTIAPRLSWETGSGLLQIGLPRADDTGGEPGALAAAGLASLDAASAGLVDFASDVATVVAQLTSSTGPGENAPRVAAIAPDPIAAAAAARRAERKADQIDAT